MLILPGVVALAAALPWPAQDLPRVVVDHDDFVLDRSCEVVIPAGLVLADRGDPGVIRIKASGIRVRFAAGSELRGAEPGTPWDRLEGVGIRLQGADGVVLEGLRVHGYRAAVHATACDRLTVAGADLSDNFRQRLRSTPLAEDGADWLWPHENDDNQWLERYGAALYLEDGSGAEVREVRVRRGQNGIVLDRMDGCRIYDNDCSFLSGWGLALWRSSDNLICRNAFDFCVRGYSHGVYNRGQDSAGILMFEQCCRNRIVLNSATHGGDGFFGFAGREALGESGRHPSEWYRRRGNNDNLLLANDFSWAAAHGIEMTFSFGNHFLGNRLEGNAICGIWGGYSQDCLIQDNDIAGNGEMGYGLERGGVNIDHSRGNRILGNRFHANRCGVHLWALPTDFAERPWGRANDLAATGNLVAGNRFEGDALALHLRGTAAVSWGGNELVGVERGVDAGAEARLETVPAPELPAVPEPGDLPGRSRPVGARPELAGRRSIVVGPWGPWDHEEPLLLLRAAGPGRREYEIHPSGLAPVWEAAPDHDPAVTVARQDLPAGGAALRFTAGRPGLHRLHGSVRAGDSLWPIDAWLVRADWQVRFFPWSVDPREDEEAWRRQAEGVEPFPAEGIDFSFGGGGPAGFLPPGHPAPAGLGSDHFGTLAETRLRLPAGRYRLRTISDDGIRVRVDGRAVVEDWTWHPPKEVVGVFELDREREVRIEVEHFELDGFARLTVGLEPEDG